MKRFIAVIAVGLALGGLGQARADTISLSGNFNYPIYMNVQGGVAGEGGGVLPGATLTVGSTTTAIADLYCVELYRVIYVPGTYNTKPTNDGVLLGGTAGAYTVANGGEIAWLLVNVAPTVANDATGQEALQAAIWNLAETEGGLGTTPTLDVDYYNVYNPTLVADYNADLANAAANSAFSVSNITWFSNYDSNGNPVQSLIGNPAPPPPGNDTSASPEPTSLALFGIGIAGLAGYRWKRRKLAAA
jgi:PEP-CTERM motif